MHKKFAIIPLFLALVISCSKAPADNTPAVEFNMENPEITKFIDYVYANPYTVSNFKTTYIENYYQNPEKNNYRGDCPASMKIDWKSEPSADSYTITLSENKDLSNPERRVSLTAGATSYSVTNLIPGHSYYCSVSANFSSGNPTEVYFKKINVKGRRRMIALESTGNFRDLGGLRTESGKQVRYGQIFRGARCSAQGVTLSDNDKKELIRLGVKADLDLRQYDKDKLGPDEYKPDPKDRHSPISKETDYCLFQDANNSYFAYLLENDEYIKAMQWLIDELKAGKPVYFHCKTGADRTGTLGWLIESLLGVTEVDKSIDFEITSFFKEIYESPQSPSYSFRSRNVDKNSNKKYDWGAMYNLIDKNFKGNNISEKVYNYFRYGIEKKDYTTIIKPADLDWFINHMLE